MVIKANFNKAAFRERLQQQYKRVQEAMLANLSYLGEQVVSAAREGGTYTDRTGNLRSSIGYLVLYNGVPQTQDFAGEPTGTAKALSYAHEIAAKYPSGYVLIVVAGMDYATAVESRNRLVLTAFSQELAFELELATERLKHKLRK